MNLKKIAQESMRFDDFFERTLVEMYKETIGETQTEPPEKHSLKKLAAKSMCLSEFLERTQQEGM
jgi:hypothetical protein